MPQEEDSQTQVRFCSLKCEKEFTLTNPHSDPYWLAITAMSNRCPNCSAFISRKRKEPPVVQGREDNNLYPLP